MTSQTTTLLRAWVDAAPIRADKVARLLRDAGMDEQTISRELKLRVGKPDAAIVSLPTFDVAVFQSATPMLKERFAFAGTIRDATEIWLSPADMAKSMVKPKVLKHIRSIAAHWENSIPMQVPPSRVTLFSYVVGEEENQTLIVWPETPGKEPELVRYAGQSERRFPSLDAFLSWAIDAD